MNPTLRVVAFAALTLSCAELVKQRINGEVAFEDTDTKLNPAEAEAKPPVEAHRHIHLTEGYTRLQSASHPFEFRNIEVLELKL